MVSVFLLGSLLRLCEFGPLRLVFLHGALDTGHLVNGEVFGKGVLVLAVEVLGVTLIRLQKLLRVQCIPVHPDVFFLET